MCALSKCAYWCKNHHHTQAPVARRGQQHCVYNWCVGTLAEFAMYISKCTYWCKKTPPAPVARRGQWHCVYNWCVATLVEWATHISKCALVSPSCDPRSCVSAAADHPHTTQNNSISGCRSRHDRGPDQKMLTVFHQQLSLLPWNSWSIPILSVVLLYVTTDDYKLLVH